MSDEQLRRLKQEMALAPLVEAFGVVLKPHGSDLVGHCPFHDDKTPSLVISPEKNLWHCLGACQTGGSVIDWVMKTQHVSFRHAVELLRDRAFSLAAQPPASAAAKTDTADTPATGAKLPQLSSPVTADADDQQLLQQVIDYYHHSLQQSPEALAYLKQRGLDDPVLIETFRLGYANRTLGLRLPGKNRKAGQALREQLQRIGLYRATGREHFNGSLVIPVIDTQGRITEVYGRKLSDKLRAGTPKHTYLPGPHRGLFNAAGLMDAEEIILCESLIDALTFWRAGFHHVTASFGINGFTDELLAALSSPPVRRVLIAYDSDSAGDQAGAGVAKTLAGQNIAVFRIRFALNGDANEIACQQPPASETLARLIRRAHWCGHGPAPAVTSAATQPLTVTVDDAEPSTSPPPLTTPETELPAPTLAPLAAEPSSQPAAATADTLPPPASPIPALPATVTLQAADNALYLTRGDRHYRVRGLEPAGGIDQLKLQLRVSRAEAFHIDKLDLYSSKQRQVFINQASVELGVKDEWLKKDLGQLLLALEQHQATPAPDDTPESEPSAGERDAALELLRDPELLKRIAADITRTGLIGEERNAVVGYLACVSRQLARPLAVLIQSTSAAGKSTLMEAILTLMPESARVHYSAMTGQSLFYMGETELQHKILALSEEEGVQQASYALKLLQSEGRVSIASTGKDDSSGQLVTKTYSVEGPVMLMLTTTAIDLDEELLNRCLVLSVNESREQTRAIHHAQRQRRTLTGLERQLERDAIIQRHRHAQQLLRPLAVVNPFAERLRFVDDQTRTRRDHEKYLTLIDSIALLHQHQRPIKTLRRGKQTLDYIEVSVDDIAAANRLAHDVLGKTLDELPAQTRKLLAFLQSWVGEHCQSEQIGVSDYRFSRRQLRQASGWGNTQLKIHLQRLVEMEYVLVHRGGRGQSFEYELLYDNRDNQQPHLMGLIDVAALQKATHQNETNPKETSQKEAQSPSEPSYDAQRSGSTAQRSEPGRAAVGGWSEADNAAKPRHCGAFGPSGRGSANRTLRGV